MHNATTKQRLSALRRKLGIFCGAPRWVRERRARLEAAAESVFGLGRGAARAAEATPAAAFAGPTSALSASLPDPGASSARWVSDSMLLPETRSGAATEQVGTADLLRTADGVEPPETEPSEAAQRSFPWRTVAAIAALAVAVGGLLLALRARAPAAPERSAAVEAPAPAVPVPAPLVAPSPAVSAAAAQPALPPGKVLVRRGDTLWALAAAHLGDPLRWPRLHAANRERIHDPDLIYPGQRLDIPAR